MLHFSSIAIWISSSRVSNIPYCPHRVLCRAKLIPFVHELRYNLLATRVINHAFDDAPSALPSLLHLGSKLSDMDPHALQLVMSKIKEAIPTLDSRILMEYTLTLASASVVGGTNYMYVPLFQFHSFRSHRVWVMQFSVKMMSWTHSTPSCCQPLLISSTIHILSFGRIFAYLGLKLQHQWGVVNLSKVHEHEVPFCNFFAIRFCTLLFPIVHMSVLLGAKGLSLL